MPIAKPVLIPTDAPRKLEADERLLLTIRGAAEALSMTEKGLREKIAAGQVPRTLIKRIGRRMFINRDQLQKWCS